MYLNAVNNYGISGTTIGLTLTWDVFKLLVVSYYTSCILWLTLTWDVFK